MGRIEFIEPLQGFLERVIRFNSTDGEGIDDGLTREYICDHEKDNRNTAYRLCGYLLPLVSMSIRRTTESIASLYVILKDGRTLHLEYQDWSGYAMTLTERDGTTSTSMIESDGDGEIEEFLEEFLDMSIEV